MIPHPGLNEDEADRLLEVHGPNTLEERQGHGLLRIARDQLTSPVIWLLLAGATLSLVLHEVLDAAAIGAIVVLVTAIGTFQEYRAELALEALARMTAPRARVRRGGRVVEISASEVVPGDVLVVEAGDVVAADAEVLDGAHLRLDEAVLTGESRPVPKHPGALPEDTPMAERSDRLFAGTAVAAGTGLARVTTTGMATEVGRIAAMLGESSDPRTPLQRQLDSVGRSLMIVCLLVVALTAALGVWRGIPPAELALISIALAVAAVPEGLPAMVTVALALGVRRMAARNVLVRKLSAVETLGGTTVICTDKTGTLTEGRMAVREFRGDAEDLLQTMASCSDADLDSQTGDTTELALLEAAAGLGIHRAAIERENPRVDVQPFESDLRLMWIRREDGQVYMKGALEAVMQHCADPPDSALAESRAMATGALRVLAAARGPELGSLQLVGTVGLADPPRPEVREALKQARSAGIRTIMVTGDHPQTAQAIARELGLVQDGDDPAELVRARVTAAKKLALVRELRAAGEVVAMTGDGVNDAPAVREADIGVAMGRAGTEVTRGASDMVLLDDNYASIVAAVREGRGIWDDIHNALVYLLGGNSGEIMVIVGSMIAGLPPVLNPLQILWVNLVSDGLPALALVTERPAHDVLQRPPRDPSRPILGLHEWRAILIIGVIDMAVVLSVYAWALSNTTVEQARTMAFTALVSCELLRSLAARSERDTAIKLNPFTNPALVAAITGTLSAQLLLLHVPAAREVFELAPLTLEQQALAFGVGLIPVTIHEVHKLLVSRD